MRKFLIGDLHLDHGNIIEYCGRPFGSAEEMNDYMVKMWNETVCPRDLVYYLGDVSFGRGCRPPSFWLPRLNGRKVLIKGNHDRSRDLRGFEWYNSLVRSYNGAKFLLIHAPEDAPWDWNGWIIHGHHHDNNLRKYPFIERVNQTVNVSAEVLNYKPIELEVLMARVFGGR